MSITKNGLTHCIDTRPDPLSQLLIASGNGDEEAFSALYEQTVSRALGVALRVICDRHLAEDATQEAYLKIWRTASRYDPTRGSGLNWVLMVVHRSAVSHVRTASARAIRDHRFYRATTTVPAPEDDPTYDHVLGSVRVELAVEALSRLSPAQQQALRLAYFGGYSYREVADLLELPPGTVKTRIRDGLIRLRTSLTHLAPAASVP